MKHHHRQIFFAAMLGLGVLTTPSPLEAQFDLPAPVTVGVTVNQSEHPLLNTGSPLLANVILMLYAETGVTQIPLVAGWTNGLHIEMRDSSGNVIPLPFHLADAPYEDITLDSVTYAEAVFWLSPEELQSVTAGDYVVTAELDSAEYFAGSWGSSNAVSTPLRITVRNSPVAAILPHSDKEKLLLANLRILAGDVAGAGGILDSILAGDPSNVEAMTLQGTLREETGNLGDAIRSYASGTKEFYKKNSHPEEPPVELARLQLNLENKLDTMSSFVVTLGTKDSTHPLYGYGSTSEYSVDGIPFRELHFTRGKTYTFHLKNIPATDPFYVTTTLRGGGGAPFSVGVSGTPANGNDVVTFSVGFATPDTLYYESMSNQYVGWRIRVTDSATITAVPGNRASRPLQFHLFDAYPNPFNPTTTIRYDLPERSHVRIVIYDVLGREIAILADEAQEAGSKFAVWNASNTPSGVYFCRLEAQGSAEARKFTETKKMILLR